MSQGPQASALSYLLLWIPLLLIFYFIIIRPQRQEQKKHLEMLKNLSKNDEVVTSAGIHGTIVNVKERTFILRIDDNVKIEVEKSAIGHLKTKSQEPAVKK